MVTAPPNWSFLPQEVALSPSFIAGVSRDDELNRRAFGVQRLMQLKDLMASNQLVLSTAVSFLHRFYMRSSMQGWNVNDVAAAAFFLAAKVEEESRALRTVVCCSLELDQGDPMTTRNKYQNEQKRIVEAWERKPEFSDARKKILWYEEALLRVLSFDLELEHPDPVLVTACERLWKGGEAQRGREVAEVGWAILNDSLLTTGCLLYQREVLAASAFVLAIVQLEMDLPVKPTKVEIEEDKEEGEEEEETEQMDWLEIFGVTPRVLRGCIEQMAGYYANAEDAFVRSEGIQLRREALELIDSLRSPTPPPPSAPEVLSNDVPVAPSEDAKPSLAEPTIEDLPSKPTEDVKMEMESATATVEQAPHKLVLKIGSASEDLNPAVGGHGPSSGGASDMELDSAVTTSSSVQWESVTDR
ncbi:cyclin Pch1 [Pseudohyphozyma bogoriensis]|nr:cyclin Pch1 [Pseudohyphozyma bogoriensis]